MGRLPDFIVIGAMKCGTSTLHEQLSRAPGVAMSDPKEPQFFSDDDVYARGMEWYASLFDGAAPAAIAGEASTNYTKRPTHPKTVVRMRAALPDVRLVYMMRHPVERLVSHYIHEWTQRVIDAPIDAAVERHPELVDYGRYAWQLEPYLDAYGTERILPVFLERMKREPQAELGRVWKFIGAPGEAGWREDVGVANRSNERLRTCAWRDALLNAPGATAARRLLPQSWRDRVKRRWTMNERPALGEDARRRVEGVFDEDLARLGEWLGRDLSCETFASVTEGDAPEWTAARAPARASA